MATAPLLEWRTLIGPTSFCAAWASKTQPERRAPWMNVCPSDDSHNDWNKSWGAGQEYTSVASNRNVTAELGDYGLSMNLSVLQSVDQA
jgi:hypothetical protein